MIVYNKLGNYLKSKNMKYIDLQRKLELSPSMTAKFTKNRSNGVQGATSGIKKQVV